VSRAVKVLLVDDNESLRITAGMILRGSGFEVSEAGDGEEAITRLAEDEFDVVLLDMRMPKLDGMGVVEKLAADRPVVVMVSAYEFEPSLKQQMGRRVFKYLQKPVGPRELIETVSQAGRVAVV
jgi:two-component system, NtrC family, nitrogen regulation response regulator NtrX